MSDVQKHYGDFQALTDINLSVNRGEVVVVVGPSGSGKSTLCRTINRLETITSGRITIDGADHEALAGTLVFVPDPALRRSAVALEDGTSALAVGGRVGEPYEVSPWESTFVASSLDPEDAADLMAREAAARPDNAGVLYNAACFEALAGRREDALAHLRAALELEPETVRGWARGDSDLDSLRDDPAFPA